MLIYFDSVILIYLLDHTGTFNARAKARLTALVAAGDQVALSQLTRLECRVHPIRFGDTAKLTLFDAFFARPDVQLVSISTPVFERATRIRAVYGYRLADALHLAAAVEGRCGAFLTNDMRLAGFPDIPVEVLP